MVYNFILALFTIISLRIGFASSAESCHNPNIKCEIFCCKTARNATEHCCPNCRHSIYIFTRETMPCLMGQNVGALAGMVISGLMAIGITLTLTILIVVYFVLARAVVALKSKPKANEVWIINSPRESFIKNSSTGSKMADDEFGDSSSEDTLNVSTNTSKQGSKIKEFMPFDTSSDSILDGQNLLEVKVRKK